MYEELQDILAVYQDAQLHAHLGVEPAISQYFQDLFSNVQLGPLPVKPTGGFEVMGSLELALVLNLHSRIASRVLLQLQHVPYKKEEDIYNCAGKISWEDWFTPAQTLRVDVTAQKSNLNSINFITLRIKDAICDRFREIQGRRPSIETATPDVRVMAFINASELSIYIDTSGEALFKRGWRDEKGAAPLKENLAAGILALTAWRADMPLFDPMCGSGTFLIEAAQIARLIPPGAIRAGLLKVHTAPAAEVAVAPPLLTDLLSPLADVPQTPIPLKAAWAAPIAVDSGKAIASPQNKPFVTPQSRQAAPVVQSGATSRARHSEGLNTAPIPYQASRVDLVGVLQGFGFLRLKPFAQKSLSTAWESIKQFAVLRMQQGESQVLRIAGSDINEQMVAITKNNWQKAGLPGLPMVRQIDALVAKSPFGEMKKPGIVICNPPYGERLELKGGRGDGEVEKKSRGARDPLPKNISDPEFVEFLVNYGRHIKEHFDAWQMDVLTADMGLPGQLRMKETKRTPLFNGAIECRLFRFELRKSPVKITNPRVDKEG